MGRDNIGSLLKQLRINNKYTLDEVGKIIGVSKQTLYKYENNIISNIPSDKIELLAKLYNVSPALIMGWDTLNEQCCPIHQHNIIDSNKGGVRAIPSLEKYALMKEISKNIKNLLRDRKIKQIELSKKTNIPPSTLSGYIKGNFIPNQKNIEKIAHFFEVDIYEIDPRHGWDKSYIERYQKEYDDKYLNSNKDRDFYDKSSYHEIEDQHYYSSPQVNFRAEYARVNEGILLDASKDLTDEELESVINIVNQLRNKGR